MNETAPTASLDRGSGVPLYLQIKRVLAGEIKAGAADALAMTEQGLTERFRVSRATVRHALQELVTEGLVYRERSKGTFPVEQMNIDRPATLRTGGLVGYLRSLGMDPTSQVTRVRREVPDAVVGEALALAAGETVLVFERLISASGTPLSLALVHVRSPEAFLPTAAELESAGSVVSLLDRDHGIVAERSEHHVWASTASERESRALDIPEHSAILAVESIMRTREGRPVIWRRIADRADVIKHTFFSGV